MTTITLNEEQTKLLLHILGSAPSAELNELERKSEQGEFESNEELAEAHAQFKAVRELCEELEKQLRGEALEKKILGVLLTTQWMTGSQLLKGLDMGLKDWSAVQQTLDALVASKHVRASGLGYIQVL